MRTLITCLFVIFTMSAYSQIKKYNESASNFNPPIKIDSSRGIFQYKDMYRAYKKAGSGFANLSKLQNKLEASIKKFAKKKNKDFIVLGRETSKGPYIIGRYPAIEIIFVLVDK